VGTIVRLIGAGLALLLLGCATAPTVWRGAPRIRVAPGVADSVRTSQLAPGVVVHHLVRVAGPQRAVLLDVDLHACVTLRAVKGSATSVGRRTTSDLLATESAGIAAVNADFFSFTPPGVPVGAMVERGQLFAGPVTRPVFAVDSAGAPFLGELHVGGFVAGLRDTVAITNWNRPDRTRVSIVDAHWGQALDTSTAPGARLLVPRADGAGGHIVREPAVGAPVRANGDTLLLVGARVTSFRVDEPVTVTRSWSPMIPREAVGGFPWLVRDSVMSTTLATDGAASFRGPNPRTAVGLAVADGH
jgi:hypothetical protein